MGYEDGKVKTAKPTGCNLQRVEEQICNGKWNTEMIRKVFTKEDADKIVAMAISICGNKDRLSWKYSSTGQYTVKSAYAVAMKEKEEQIQRKNKKKGGTGYAQSKIWKCLWSLQMKHKLKHFVWRCLQNSIPVNELISKRTGKRNPNCDCCENEVETLEHMLFFCPNADITWRLAPVQWDGLREWRSNFVRWWEGLLEAKVRRQGMDHICLTVNILWQIWKDRNRRVFEKEGGDGATTMHRAVQEWLEYSEAQSENSSQDIEASTQSQSANIWQPPSRGTIKINTDTAIAEKQGKTSIAAVARDWRGKIIKGWATPATKISEPLLEEAEAIRLGLQMAMETGCKVIEVQSDCKAAIDQILDGQIKDSKVAVVLDDILKLKGLFDQCRFSFVSRVGDSCAHELAKFATASLQDLRWDVSFPMWLQESARNDSRAVVPFGQNLVLSSYG